MHIQNPTKTTIHLNELPEFISHHGLTPSQMIATGLEINGDRVEVQYLKSADYPRAKLDAKLAIPVVWTPGYAYLGNIQANKLGAVVVEGEPRFMAHPQMTRFVRVFRQMFSKTDKPVIDLFCATPTQALETTVGTWDAQKAFKQPKDGKLTNIRLLEDGLLAAREASIVHASMIGDGIVGIKDGDWVPVAGDNGHDTIILLGRLTQDKKIVATTEMGKQFVVDISKLTPQNRKAQTGIPVEDGNFFFGVTGGQFLAYLTRKEGAQREQRLILTPKTGQHAPQIASQLQ